MVQRIVRWTGRTAHDRWALVATFAAAYIILMGTLLAIDTAAPRLALALLRDDGPVDMLIEDMQIGQAERLFPAIAEILARNDLGYADLTRIAVTTGPGSFTGLRIGLSASRGLGLALDIPVIGTTSLAALSLAARSAPVAVLLDARRGEVYLQMFSAPAKSVGEAALLPIGEARARIPAAAEVVTGPFVDMALLARFALTADPRHSPPEAAYVRAADAKPQDRFRVARLDEKLPEPLS